MSRDQNRRQFDAEFKREAVRLSQEPGRTMASVARDLGIGETNLWRWRKKLAESGESAFPGTGHVSADHEELRRLRRELTDVTEERDILKKALAVFSRRPK
jgi:transposase-like protein